MKVETPQILWNSEGDKGLNAALYSISMLESGVGDYDGGFEQFGNVLATSGNTNVINLWKVCFRRCGDAGAANTAMFQSALPQHPQNKKQKKRHTAANDKNQNYNHHRSHNNNDTTSSNENSNRKIDFLCSLSRHEQAVNTVSFSPDGLHLATAGDTGSIIVWSVPLSKRGNGNGKHYWSTITRESDLVVKVVPTASGSGGITDISWSSDSKRFLCGTIDHTVFVVEDMNYNASGTTDSTGTTTASDSHVVQQQLDSNWKIIYRNGMDHTQYVQGVSYDPQGVYLTSMSSDRSVRVFARKTPPKLKKKVIRPFSTTTNTATATTSTSAADSSSTASPGVGSATASAILGPSTTATSRNTYSNPVPPAEHRAMVNQLLSDAKFELHKSKQIKFRRIITTNDNENTNTENGDSSSPATTTLKRHLYADESTLESFFRRLSWTTDGSFLITPAALWHPPSETSSSSPPSFATYLFARHKFDEPYKVLSGLEKPSVVVRPNPRLYQLPESAVLEDCKENQNPSSTSSSSNGNLPYRSIFAVLTLDSVLVYDTHHVRPLCVIRGLHYANLVDCTWSADGSNLVVCSTDGYVSFVSFAIDELGKIYHHPQQQASLSPLVTPKTSNKNDDKNFASNVDQETAEQKHKPPLQVQGKKEPMIIPPCEPGQSATLEAPPSKRMKKTRITPTLISTSLSTNASTCPVTSTSEAVRNKLTLKNNNSDGNSNEKQEQQPVKKKKRIQPMLVCTSVS